MHRWIVLAFVAALLISCGGNSKASQIESLLIQPADIPAGDTAGSVQTSATSMLMYFDLPPNKEMRHQEVLRDGKRDGWTTVFLYPSAADQDAVYRKFVEGLGTDAHSIAGLGEKAMGTDYVPGDDGFDPDITFVRCGAVVFVRVTTPTQAAIDYAKRLDQRITPVLCQ